MGRTGIFVLSFLAILVATLQSGIAHTCREITIGGHPSFPPLIWSDGERLRGAGPDIAMKVFKDIGVEVNYWEKQPYARVQHHLERGKIDLLAGMAKNEKRDQYTHFVEPPVTTIVPYIFTAIDRVFHFYSWDQLKELRGVAQIGITFGTEFDQYAKEHLNISYVDTTEKALKLVASGRVDYVLHYYRHTQIEIDRLNYDDQIVALNKPLGGGEENIYFGFSRLSPCRSLATEFSEELKKYVDSGAVERLMDTYMWKFGVF